MKRILQYTLATVLLVSVYLDATSQRRGKSTATPPSLMSDSTFNGIELRSIGPAMMAGRIADIAIHPEDDNIWYVAVGSGGVWKTANAGVY